MIGTSKLGTKLICLGSSHGNKQVRHGLLATAPLSQQTIPVFQRPNTNNNYKSRFYSVTTAYFQELANTSSDFRAKRKSFQVISTKLDKRFRMEWPKICLFGDSITRRSVDPDNGCWGSMISYKVGDYFDVNARGFEGYNSKWALENVEKLFPKSYLDKVEVFIPFFGHNDSWSTTLALGVPVEEYESNIRSIIKYLNDNGLENRKIILITPTWFHREVTQRFMASQKQFSGVTLDKDPEAAQLYADAILRIGKDNNIDVVDFFKTSYQYEDLESMFCDGIHLSRLGARMLYDELMPVIERKIEESFKKPLGDLWHLPPFEQQPEVKKQIEMLMKLRAE